MDETNGELPHAAQKVFSANPYENQVIGRFLVNLGFQAGKDGDEKPPIVDLLQQTPLDALMGDAVFNNHAFLFLIEFKRNVQNVKQEQKKWLDEFRKSIATHAPFLKDFAEAHLIAYGSADGTTVEAASYMQAVFGAVQAKPVADLVQHVRDPGKGKRQDAMTDYITKLLNFREAFGEDGQGDGDGSGGGPAIVAVANVNGTKRSYGVSIAALSLQLKELLVVDNDSTISRNAPKRGPGGGMSP